MGVGHLEDCQPWARLQVPFILFLHHPLLYLTWFSDSGLWSKCGAPATFYEPGFFCICPVSTSSFANLSASSFASEGHKAIRKAFSDEGNQLLSTGRERWANIITLPKASNREKKSGRIMDDFKHRKWRKDQRQSGAISRRGGDRSSPRREQALEALKVMTGSLQRKSPLLRHLKFKTRITNWRTDPGVWTINQRVITVTCQWLNQEHIPFSCQYWMRTMSMISLSLRPNSKRHLMRRAVLKQVPAVLEVETIKQEVALDLEEEEHLEEEEEDIEVEEELLEQETPCSQEPSLRQDSRRDPTHCRPRQYWRGWLPPARHLSLISHFHRILGSKMFAKTFTFTRWIWCSE